MRILLEVRATRLFLKKLISELLNLIDLVLNAVKQVLLLLVQQAKLLLKPCVPLVRMLDLHHTLVQLLLVKLVFLDELLGLLIGGLHLLNVPLDLLGLRVELVPHVRQHDVKVDGVFVFLAGS